VIRRLLDEYTYQIKFVIDSPADLEFVGKYLTEFSDIARERVLLMPQGIEQVELEARAAWLRPFCDEEGLVFCPRMQIEWYGPVRGT
jgi:7-carboxy-7-deazaguanine synthase